VSGQSAAKGGGKFEELCAPSPTNQKLSTLMGNVPAHPALHQPGLYASGTIARNKNCKNVADSLRVIAGCDRNAKKTLLAYLNDDGEIRYDFVDENGVEIVPFDATAPNFDNASQQQKEMQFIATVMQDDVSSDAVKQQFQKMGRVRMSLVAHKKISAESESEQSTQQEAAGERSATGTSNPTTDDLQTLGVLDLLKEIGIGHYSLTADRTVCQLKLDGRQVSICLYGAIGVEVSINLGISVPETSKACLSLQRLMLLALQHNSKTTAGMFVIDDGELVVQQMIMYDQGPQPEVSQIFARLLGVEKAANTINKERLKFCLLKTISVAIKMRGKLLKALYGEHVCTPGEKGDDNDEESSDDSEEGGNSEPNQSTQASQTSTTLPEFNYPPSLLNAI